MGLRHEAKLAETAAVQLAQKGRGILGHRERRTEKVIGQFVSDALHQPPGGVLPPQVRSDLGESIERAISALETHVARAGDRSARRIARDTGVVRQVYALREAQQHLLQTQHFIY